MPNFVHLSMYMLEDHGKAQGPDFLCWISVQND